MINKNLRVSPWFLKADRQHPSFLLSEQILKASPGIACPSPHPACGATSARGFKEIAEVRAVLVPDPFCLRFVALVVGGAVIVSAIQATVQVGIAFRTGILSSDAAV